MPRATLQGSEEAQPRPRPGLPSRAVQELRCLLRVQSAFCLLPSSSVEQNWDIK